MYKKKKILTIITARSGSKGLRNKNIVKIGGKHLIGFTIEASLKSKYVDKTIVSTDSEKYILISKKYGADVPFKRPKKLSGPKSHHPDVCIHAIDFLERKGFYFDIVIMLQPTSPFRNSKHLDKAIEKYFKLKTNSLISLKEQEYPPWWMFKTINKKISPLLRFEKKNVFNLERQQFPKVYRPNGAIYITTGKILKKGNLVDPQSCGYYIMDLKSSVDIDNEFDYEYAKKIYYKVKSQ